MLRLLSGLLPYKSGSAVFVFVSLNSTSLSVFLPLKVIRDRIKQFLRSLLHGLSGFRHDMASFDWASFGIMNQSICLFPRFGHLVCSLFDHFCRFNFWHTSPSCIQFTNHRVVPKAKKEKKKKSENWNRGSSLT